MAVKIFFGFCFFSSFTGKGGVPSVYCFKKSHAPMQFWCQPCFRIDGLRSLSAGIVRGVRNCFDMCIVHVRQYKLCCQASFIECWYTRYNCELGTRLHKHLD